MDFVNVDLMGANGHVKGDVANQLVNNNNLNVGLMRPFWDDRTQMTWVTVYKGGDPVNPSSWQTQPFPRPINTNATLRRDEWKQLDEAILIASRYRLGGIDDLITNNLTYNLGNAMGTTVLEWHDVSDGLSAIVTMDGVTRANNDRPNFQYNYLPIPIIHVDYEINARELAASRNMGNSIDTTMVEYGTRKINETLENMLFTNTTFNFGEKDSRSRDTIYSYINFPDRNLVTLSIPWDHSACTAAGILQDVQDMKAAAVAAYHYGPYMLYVPSAYERVLDDDYNAVANASTMTVRERILKLANIKGIKVIDTLPTDNVLLVQMTPDVVRLVRGLGLQNVEWDTEGKFVTKYKLLTIQVPQIRSDQNGKCGVVHMTT
jgi:hypothetical protein